MKYFTLVFLFLLILAKTPPEKRDSPAKLIFSKNQLRDKIMGGWAGQTIGVAFGEYAAFDSTETLPRKQQKIAWHKGYLKENFEKNPDLYDDLYMDLTFMEVFEKNGLDAPVKSFAKAYVEQGYNLSHANQAGRYNILHGIDPPLCGHWLNNPHADDIDFQIESDFAGLMSPGMPRSASQICDKIGHMMSYGDGFYGGLYIANLYALAFVDSKIENVVREALKSIPHRTEFYECINDVIRWHKMYPDDWKHTWFEIQKEWGEDFGCPDHGEDVLLKDAKLSSALVTLGLLYGNGDYTNTMEIASRTGHKSIPSTTGGILGVIKGYKKIPDFWKQDLNDIETLDFKFTEMSLHDAYETSYRHALKIIERNGGKIKNDEITIIQQKPLPAKIEKSFEGHYPIEKRSLKNKVITNQVEFDFEGIGFVLKGAAAESNSASDFVFHAEMYINNKFMEKAELPVNFTNRRSELFWKFQLPYGKYRVKIVILNPSAKHALKVSDVIIYTVRDH